jgi:branched-chain amino acid transport system ATP-binding protein
MSESFLEISDIVGGYGYGSVLRGATLSVKPGAITCLIGPNGAGKSTLLRAVSGLLTVQSGTITLKGEALHGCSPRHILTRGVVQVPQDRSLFPAMTVYENLLMGGYILDDRRLLAERVAAALDQFPVAATFRNARAGSLSGGQQRIVEFARALILDPVLVLADEPSLGLDPKSRAVVFEGLRTLVQQGRTVLVVEQNARSALKISDYAAVLELGRVRLSGRAADLLDDPEVGRLYLGASAAAHRRPPHTVHART